MFYNILFFLSKSLYCIPNLISIKIYSFLSCPNLTFLFTHPSHPPTTHLQSLRQIIYLGAQRHLMVPLL